MNLSHFYAYFCRWHHDAHRHRGQSLVEFALVAPLFFLLLWGIFAGAWYVLEVSAVTNAAREAASWEVAGANFTTVTPASGSPLSEPYCMAGTGATVPAGLVTAAVSTAGPFAQEIRTAAADGELTNGPGASGANGTGECTVSITIPYSPLETFVQLGPRDITSSSTASWG